MKQQVFRFERWHGDFREECNGLIADGSHIIAMTSFFVPFDGQSQSQKMCVMHVLAEK